MPPLLPLPPVQDILDLRRGFPDLLVGLLHLVDGVFG